MTYSSLQWALGQCGRGHTEPGRLTQTWDPGQAPQVGKDFQVMLRLETHIRQVTRELGR